MTKLYGVITQGHRALVVPEKWLESKENKFSKVFFSPNSNENADFDLPLNYFFNEQIRACYNCEIRRELGKTFFVFCLKNRLAHFNLKSLILFKLEPENVDWFLNRKRRRTRPVNYADDSPSKVNEMSHVFESIDLTNDGFCNTKSNVPSQRITVPHQKTVGCATVVKTKISRGNFI